MARIIEGALRRYAELMHIIDVGAYTEGDNGEYFFGDRDMSAEATNLDLWATADGLKFVCTAGNGYKLEQLTDEDRAALVVANVWQEE